MPTSNGSIKYLSALLAGATALLLGFIFVSLGHKDPPNRWLLLALQVIPSLIAALVAYAAIYFVLEMQGISLNASIEEKSQLIANKLFKYQYGDPKRKPITEHDLRGHWRLQDWRHGHPEDIELAFSEDVQIYQDGPLVWGTFSTLQGRDKDNKPSPSEYAFHADLEGDILTGRWWQRNDKSPWKGVFQFKVIPGNLDREVMDGCWAGFNFDKTKINSGAWEWARAGQQFPSERCAKGSLAAPHAYALRTREEIPEINRFCEQATKIRFVVVAGSELLREHRQFFIEKVKSGCTLEISVLDPESTTLESYQKQETQPNMRREIETSLDIASEIQQTVNNDNIEIRLLEHLLPFSAIAVEFSGRSRSGAMIVRSHGYKVDFAMCPHIILSTTDRGRWYKAYKEQVDRAWETGTLWIPAAEQGA